MLSLLKGDILCINQISNSKSKIDIDRDKIDIDNLKNPMTHALLQFRLSAFFVEM